MFLTPTQAAEILHVSPSVIRRYARQGVVPAHKDGKFWRFLERDLERGYKDQHIPGANGAFELIPLAGVGSFRAVWKNTTMTGIYFLIDKHDRLLYVGSSYNIKARVDKHRKEKRIPFVRATHLPIPFPWHLSAEAAYIAAYSPKYNKMHTARIRDDR